jgi:hypothetical protein
MGTRTNHPPNVLHWENYLTCFNHWNGIWVLARSPHVFRSCSILKELIDHLSYWSGIWILIPAPTMHFRSGLRSEIAGLARSRMSSAHVLYWKNWPSQLLKRHMITRTGNAFPWCSVVKKLIDMFLIAEAAYGYPHEPSPQCSITKAAYAYSQKPHLTDLGSLRKIDS